MHGFIKKMQKTVGTDIDLAKRRFKEWRNGEKNPHSGSGFDDFLKDERIFDQVQAKGLKRAFARKREDGMTGAKLT